VPADNRIAYLPIESRTRELPSRVLIARALVDRGITAVIGFGEAVYAGGTWWPRGVYLGKGLNAVQARIAAILRHHGHRFAAIDEEALGISDPWFMCRDIDPTASDLVDRVFCQGDVQRLALMEHRNFLADQLVVTGNPRIDLLRTPFRSMYVSRVDKQRADNGKYVLFNTNSGSINNIWGDLRRYVGLLREIGWFDPDKAEDRDLVDDHLTHDRNNFQAMQRTIRLLSERCPDLRIVVRPHPSERPDAWITLAEAIPNLAMVDNSEPAPWIAGAELVVTTGCTTAMEAFVLGRPAISVIDQPEGVRHPGFFLANDLSIICRSPEAAVERICAHLAGQIDLAASDRAARNAAFARHIAVDESVLAAERIAETIAAILDGANRPREQLGRQLSFTAAQHDILKQRVKKIPWIKGSFTRAYVGELLQDFDSCLGTSVGVDVTELPWSTMLMSPVGSHRFGAVSG
jgi:surface carbohydrate biosynthesis protein